MILSEVYNKIQLEREKEREREMLAIFHKAFAHPPKELNSPASKKQKLPQDTLNDFMCGHAAPNTFSMTFGQAAVLAYVRPHTPFSPHQRYITPKL